MTGSPARSLPTGAGIPAVMNALKPRPAFDVLVMSEESRLGREAIETALRGQRRAVRQRPCALWTEQAGGLVAAARHPARTHQARTSPARRPPRAHASHAEARSHQPAAANALQQQARFDRFLRRQFKDEQPHEALEMAMPAERYAPSPRPYQGLREVHYPLHDWTSTVTTCGRICFKKRKVNLSQVFAGQNVGIRQVSDRIGLASFMHYDLGYFDDETCRLEPIENPFGPKVLPMSPE